MTKSDVPATMTPEVVRGRVTKGGLAIVKSTAARSLLEFGATLATARLLAPSDFGVVGMVMAIIGLVDMLRDLGLTTVTVQREQLSEAERSGLFWLTLGVGGSATLLMALSAPLVSWAYRQPNLTQLTLVLSTCLFLNALSAQHQAMLRRELKFEQLSVVQTVGTLVSVTTVIVAALLGLGPWALVLKQLAGPSASAACAWLLSGWLPGSPRGANVRGLVGTGAHVTGFQIANYLERNLDNALIGRFAGAAELGCYVRAYDLLRLPLQQLGEPMGTVAVPALSRLKGEASAYRDAYLRMTRALLLLTIPLTPFLVICADWLVALAFGPQWSHTVNLFRYLGLGLVWKPLGYSIGWLFISQGRNRELLRWGLLGSSLAIVSFVVGLPWGAEGVALSYTLCELCIRMPLLIWWIGRSGPIRIPDLVRLPFAAWLCAIASCAALLAARATLAAGLAPASGVLVCGPVSLAATGAVIVASRTGRQAARDLWLALTRKAVI